MSIETPLHILVAPLDWGLGHTTRCVPVIRYLLRQGHKVTVAGSQWQRSYIEETFPDIKTIHLDGYEVKYGKSGKDFMWAIFSQIPRLLKTIQKEHAWLIEQQKQYHFDAVISDNRYGLYHRDVPCVIMTHQLAIQTGLGSVSDTLTQRLHYKLINKFSSCWVVDTQGISNLSGKLAHPKQLPGHAEYIGLLSQFDTADKRIPRDNILLVLLSGPEPQRTILSDILWAQVQQYKGKVVFVEGSNNATLRENIPTHIVYYKRLSGADLLPLLQAAELVICRSGYSTIMDLVVLQKKAVLIPTPGQTEQEYLGRHLHQVGIYYTAAQTGFNLDKVLKEAQAFPYKTLQLQQAYKLHESVIAVWLKEKAAPG